MPVPLAILNISLFVLLISPICVTPLLFTFIKLSPSLFSTSKAIVDDVFPEPTIWSLAEAKLSPLPIPIFFCLSRWKWVVPWVLILKYSNILFAFGSIFITTAWLKLPSESIDE